MIVGTTSMVIKDVIQLCVGTDFTECEYKSFNVDLCRVFVVTELGNPWQRSEWVECDMGDTAIIITGTVVVKRISK